MLFSDIDAGRANALAAEVGGETRATLGELRDDCDVLLLAVKPAALGEVAKELGGEAPALLSVIAATPLSRLAQAFPGVPALRVMPNQPAEVRAGVLCYVLPDGMDAELAGRLVALLGELGEAVPVPESLIDAAMAVMSCSPAYVALIAEALTSAGARASSRRSPPTWWRARSPGRPSCCGSRTPRQSARPSRRPAGDQAGLEALQRGGIEAALYLADAVSSILERFR